MSAEALPYQPQRFTRGSFSAPGAKPTEYRRTEVQAAPPSEGARPWADLIGPVLFTRQVAERMHWTVDQVHAAQKDNALLGCRTRDGVWVFPAFQFRDVSSGELVHGFAEVMRVFQKTDADPWAVASWFVTPLRSLGGASPLEVLRSSEGEAAEDVRHVALDQSRAWRQ